MFCSKRLSSIIVAGCLGYCVLFCPKLYAQDSSASKLKRAQAALVAGWPEQTLEILNEDCTNTELKPYWIRTRAEAYLKNGQEEQALKTFEALHRSQNHHGKDHPFRMDAQRTLADRLSEKDPLRAAKLLSSASNTPKDWARAIKLFEQGKEMVGAKLLQRRLLMEAPSSSAARSLAKRLGSKGVRKLLDTQKNRMQRLRNLLSGHENRQAIAEANEFKNGYACERLYIIGKAQRKIRQYQQSINTLKKARTVCKTDSSFWMRSSLLATQVHTIKRQVRSVERIVTRMEKTDIKHSYIDDALIQLAKVYERKGQTEKAMKVFKKILSDHPSGDQINFCAWRIAYSHIRRGQFEKAIPWLKKLKGRHEAQGKYWLARAFEKSDLKTAIIEYEAILYGPPLSFYSWLALGRLEQIAPETAKRARQKLEDNRDQLRKHADSTPDKDLPKALRHSLLLKEIGFEQDAVQEALWWSADKPEQEKQLLTMRTLHKLKAYSAAQHILRWKLPKRLSSFPDKQSYSDWQIAYSLAFKNEIEAAAEKMKIDPLLLFALAREESTFDANIVSWAGAMGLCQLMPATGIGAYADVYRKRLVDTDALLDPALNAQLGAHVLKQGLKRFKGIQALALAAYNGGPRLAQNTMPKTKALDFDLWVESIGVRETRRYVKKVLQSWGRYRYLHKDTDFLVDFPRQIGPSGDKAPKKSDRY